MPHSRGPLSRLARLTIVSPLPSSTHPFDHDDHVPAPSSPESAHAHLSRLRVLFVCSKNQWRSPTAEQLYRKDPRLEVRSAGVKAEARRRVTEADLRWADVIFAMEREHRQWLTQHFRDFDLPPIEVLDIPDEFQYMDTDLQRLLRESIDPELAALLHAT
jgi:predicted protein tyrosine phosphatase